MKHGSHLFNRDLKVYIFNCTAPPGGRSIDEYKVQLILDGQKRGERGRFDTSDGKTILIVGYATPFVDLSGGIWVLFEFDKHIEFAYSANIQVYLRQILETATIQVAQRQGISILRSNGKRKPFKEILESVEATD